jgi:hypothetical protein
MAMMVTKARMTKIMVTGWIRGGVDDKENRGCQLNEIINSVSS